MRSNLGSDCELTTTNPLRADGSDRTEFTIDEPQGMTHSAHFFIDEPKRRALLLSDRRHVKKETGNKRIKLALVNGNSWTKRHLQETRGKAAAARAAAAGTASKDKDRDMVVALDEGALEMPGIGQPATEDDEAPVPLVDLVATKSGLDKPPMDESDEPTVLAPREDSSEDSKKCGQHVILPISGQDGGTIAATPKGPPPKVIDIPEQDGREQVQVTPLEQSWDPAPGHVVEKRSEQNKKGQADAIPQKSKPANLGGKVEEQGARSQGQGGQSTGMEAMLRQLLQHQGISASAGKGPDLPGKTATVNPNRRSRRGGPDSAAAAAGFVRRVLRRGRRRNRAGSEGPWMPRPRQPSDKRPASLGAADVPVRPR